MACAKRIEKRDMDIGSEKGSIVVSTIPDNNLGFVFRLLQNGGIIESGIDNNPLLDQRFVLFPFLDSTAMQVKILVTKKALHPLLSQIPVRHWMTHDHNPFP